MGTTLIRGHLEGLLLAVLRHGPAHGYAVSERLATRSGGALVVPDGSLYPALQRLERAGAVASSWAVTDGRRRRVYALTEEGRRQAQCAAHEWRTFSSAVDDILGDPA